MSANDSTTHLETYNPGGSRAIPTALYQHKKRLYGYQIYNIHAGFKIGSQFLANFPLCFTCNNIKMDRSIRI